MTSSLQAYQCCRNRIEMYLLTEKVVLQSSKLLLKQTSMEIHGKDVKKSHVNKNKMKNHNLFTFFSLSAYFDLTILSVSLFRKVKNLTKSTELSEKSLFKI